MIISNCRDITSNSRIEDVLKRCNPYQPSVVFGSSPVRLCNDSLFLEQSHSLKKYFKGMNIIEIGCGYRGGLSKMILSSGAKSYVGIDIDQGAIESSDGLEPDAPFVCDDPIYLLNFLSHTGLKIMTVSAGIFDNTIIKDASYAEELIEAISKTTPIGGYSIHSAYCIGVEFNRTFAKYGLESITDHLSDLEIYRKIR